jgi:hypothetical protein
MKEGAMTKGRPKKDAARRAAIAAAAAMLAMPPAVEDLRPAPEVVLRQQAAAPLVTLRSYQLPVLLDFHSPVLCVNLGRQTGKSFVGGEWCALRLLTQLQDNDDWLIVVISNSKANGVEFGQKVSAALRRAMAADAELTAETPAAVDTVRDPELAETSKLPALTLDDFAQRIEVRIGNKRGRVLILAASPRTARGFSGDLVLDEFAFHENARAIWDAAYPMLRSRKEFVARILSTHNGDGSLFNQWLKADKFKWYALPLSQCWRMGRGELPAWESWFMQWQGMGVKNARQAEAWLEKNDFRAPGWTPPRQDRFDIRSEEKEDAEGNPLLLTPEEALAECFDRASYLQNYENIPSEEGGSFLEWETIMAAEDDTLRVATDKDAWSEGTLARLYRLKSAAQFYIGQDFARVGDLSVVSVLAENAGVLSQVARLDMRNVKLPQQVREMKRLVDVLGPSVQRITVDATGMGMGPAESMQELFGALVLPINFAQTVAMDEAMAARLGRKAETMRITERMALDLQQLLQDKKLRLIPCAAQRESLRRPVRVVRGTQVSIAASRTPGEHADMFWALALAVHGWRDGMTGGGWTAETCRGMICGSGEMADSGDRLDWDGSGQRDGAFFYGAGAPRGYFQKRPKSALNPPGGAVFTLPRDSRGLPAKFKAIKPGVHAVFAPLIFIAGGMGRIFGLRAPVPAALIPSLT